MECDILNDPAFLTSIDTPPTLKPSSKPDLQRDLPLLSQLLTEKFQFKSQSTWLYIVSTPYKFQLNPNRYNDNYISPASKQLAPYEYWTANF